jgi:plasmid maintenance system antidote protein VapI
MGGELPAIPPGDVLLEEFMEDLSVDIDNLVGKAF